MATISEVERKWLILGEPPAEAMAVTGEQIEQGYLTIGTGGTETRIRSRAGEYILGVKAGVGLVRSETSVLLTAEQFKKLWPVTQGARIEKLRRVLPDPGADATIELDVYSGSLQGLVVAEVEFPDADAAAAFTAPAWFGPEVTDDARYKNQALAVHGRP